MLMVMTSLAKDVAVMDNGKMWTFAKGRTRDGLRLFDGLQFQFLSRMVVVVELRTFSNDSAFDLRTGKVGCKV